MKKGNSHKCQSKDVYRICGCLFCGKTRHENRGYPLITKALSNEVLLQNKLHRIINNFALVLKYIVTKVFSYSASLASRARQGVLKGEYFKFSIGKFKIFTLKIPFMEQRSCVRGADENSKKLLFHSIKLRFIILCILLIGYGQSNYSQTYAGGNNDGSGQICFDFLPMFNGGARDGYGQGKYVESIAPMVTSFSPADEATSVALMTNLVLTFSETIQKGTGNISIYRSSDNALIQTIDVTTGSVSISGNQATLDPPNDLLANTSYYVQVGSSAFSDVNGNAYGGISNTTTWNYTTIAPEIDLSASGNAIIDGATLAGTSPANGTDFGTLCVSEGENSITYTIANTGSADLNLNGSIQLSGHTGDFSVITPPGSNTIAPAGNTTFTIRFDPNQAGERSVTVTIDNDDSDEALFDFVVKGTADAAPQLGADQLNICGVTANISGTTSPGSTGSWSFPAATPGAPVLSDLMNISTSLTGVFGGNYTLRWTVGDGVCAGQFDEVNISFISDADLPGGQPDGVQDCVDVCLGGDDRINSDNTGMPDDCDCEPTDITNEFTVCTAAEFNTFVNEEILLTNPDSVKRIADFQLISYAIIEANTANYPKVIFQAGESVLLEPGFHAKAGSDFLARIGYCRDPLTGQVNTLEEETTSEERSREISTKDLKQVEENMTLEVYPSLIHDRAAIRLVLPQGEQVNLLLFNYQGQVLKRYLTGQHLEKGPHYYQLDAGYLSGGFYFLQARTSKGVVTRKLVVQK